MGENHPMKFDEKSIMHGELLSVTDIPSADYVRTAIESFLYRFTDRYPGPGPTLFIDPLDEALKHSLFDSINPCPLILNIHHDQSIATNIFCRHVLCAESITDYLAAQFIVWPWDRTYENNYSAFLSMLLGYTTAEVMKTVASFSIDAYPLLVCLSVHQGQIDILSVIQGNMSIDETLADLLKSREKFNRRAELPYSKHLQPILIPNKHKLISTSILKPLTEYSPTLQRIASDFQNDSMNIVRIDEVENAAWLQLYLKRKEIIDARLGNGETEKLLFHGCPRSAAEGIIERGFDHELIGMHGKLFESEDDHICTILGSVFGHGFYFSSDHRYCHTYTTSNRLDNDERTMLVCRVLVGQTYSGSSVFRTCPTGYESTTDGSTIYVVYSNSHILPVYIITYTSKPITNVNKVSLARFCILS